MKKKSGIDKALEDIREGRVYKAKDADDLINQIDKEKYVAGHYNDKQKQSNNQEENNQGGKTSVGRY